MFDTALTFTPLYQTRVWGGRRLESLFGRHLPEPGTPYGESWEISDREREMSVCSLRDGSQISLHDLWLYHREAVFGPGLIEHISPRYPLLMKILDACDDLSIQVHPPAAIAPKLGGESKTEAWYIAHAEPGAKLYAGLRKGVTREALARAIQDGAVADTIQILEPQVGDCLFIPSGLIHAIGAGLVIFEVQQNSDTTYRVFDWNRVGLDGKPRELHVSESLDSTSYDSPAAVFQRMDSSGLLVGCEFFQIHLNSSPRSKTLGKSGENLALAMISGELRLGGAKALSPGDFAIIPACLSEAQRSFDATDTAQWLEIRIPSGSGCS